MTKPPLGLNVQVESGDGVLYSWGANQAPGSRPMNLSFRTKLGEGFSDASLSLARRVDLDYPDLELVNDVVIVGDEGSVAYEGRVTALPRELSDAHSIGVTLAGHMAHASDRKFAEVYVDRDLGAWQGPTAARRASLLTSNYTAINAPEQKPDPQSNAATLVTGFAGGWTSPYKPISEAWYDAKDARIGQVYYSWAREGGVGSADANWLWQVLASTDDVHTANQATGTLRAAGPVANATFAPTATSYRWLTLQFLYNLTPGGGDGATWGIAWSKLAVYGRHGLALVASAEPGEPPGVAASDVIADIARRWCPQLKTDGVQATSYAIPHLVFKDRAYPYDAFLEVNKYHLWHLGVWEDKTLHFRPYDLTDYQWEVRMDDPGTTISLQGASTQDLWNGIVVKYTDLLKNATVTLTPDNFSELRYADPDNPWNRHGIDRWDEIELSAPTIEAAALQIGRAALAERNTPKTPGTITIKGHVRDRGGSWQPAWRVRAADTIAITNHPNDSPRLIHETSWDDANKTMTLSVEAPAAALDAYLDRVGVALGARGLT